MKTQQYCSLRFRRCRQDNLRTTKFTLSPQNVSPHRKPTNTRSVPWHTLQNRKNLRIDAESCNFGFSSSRHKHHQPMNMNMNMVNSGHTLAIGNSNGELCDEEPTGSTFRTYGKYVLLTGILFCNLIFYTVVRDIKDVMIVTSCGAEALPILKTWVNFPMSIMSIVYYTFLVNRGFSIKNVYRYTYIPIATLYCLVGILLYPNRALISPSMSHSITLPLFGDDAPLIVVDLIRNWVSVIFYTLSSTWGSVVISLLFWSTANQYIKVNEAKKVYPVFGFVANFALVIGGWIIKIVSEMYTSNWDLNVCMLMTIASLFAVSSVILYELLSISHTPTITEFKKVKKQALGMKEGLLNMARNPFIGNMVLLIACYGSSMTIFESLWKSNARLYFLNPSDYSQFLGFVSALKGLATILMMLVSSVCLRHMTWFQSTLLPSAVASLTGLLFFTSVLIKADSSAIVILGAVMTIMVKSTKYAFFDPNKEIAYIPMGNDIKTKGKATIDVLSSPLGKSGSSFVLQILVAMYGSLMEAAPCISLMFLGICVIWIRAIFNIDHIISRNIN